MQEEQNVGEDDDNDWNVSVPRLLQNTMAFKHQFPGGGKDVGLLKLPTHVHHGGFGVDALIDLQEPLLSLLLRHFRVDILENFLEDEKGIFRGLRNSNQICTLSFHLP